MKELEIIVGAILPFLLEIIFRWVGEKSKLKFIISLVIPLLVGTGLSYSELSTVNPEAVLASGAVIFAAAQTVYQTYFKNSDLQKRLMK